MTGHQIKTIKSKVALGLPLKRKEKATYLLFIATSEEAKEFIRKEKEAKK